MSFENDKFQQALKRVIENRVCEIHTALPGTIESYDNTSQKAEVILGVRKILLNGKTLSLPKLVEVPVLFPGSATAGIHFPMNKGDSVLIIFCERSIDNFLLTGKESNPVINRKHSLTDSVAIPGLLPFNKTSVSENNTDVIIIHKNAKVILKSNGDVEIDGDNINLGTGINLKALVNETFLTFFDTHVHTGGTIGGSTGVPTLPTLPTHQTSKVKAE